MKKFFKLFFKKLLHFLDNNLGFIEGFALLFFIINYANNSDNNSTYLLLILPCYILFVNFKYTFKLIKSNKNLHFIVKNKRTFKISGGQGLGKTSLLGLLASMCKRPVYSLTPLKINGKFCNTLTYNHLTLKTKLEKHSFCIVDELTLLFNNLQNPNAIEKLDLYAFEILIQLIRHLFDGSFGYASVDTDRATKTIREKVLFSMQMLGQTTVKSSWILGPILNRLTNWHYHGYFRVWNMQTYEKIEEDGYIFDLSTDKLNTNNNKFANLFEIVAHDNQDFEYNDKYLESLYSALDIPYEKHQFKSLNMDVDTLKTQYKKIYDFLVANRNLNINKLGGKK